MNQKDNTQYENIQLQKFFKSNYKFENKSKSTQNLMRFEHFIKEIKFIK